MRALFLALCLLSAHAYADVTDCPGCLTASELAAESEDFSDSAVGCVDDCLDTLELFTDPDTIPDEYNLNAAHSTQALPVFNGSDTVNE